MPGVDDGQMISQSPVLAGLRGRCPCCAEGVLFSGPLKLKPQCEVCGLDLQFADVADGPMVFVIFLLGLVIAGAALLVEFTYEPPTWVHLALWPVVTALTALGLLRCLKGLFIALQFRNRAAEGRLDHS